VSKCKLVVCVQMQTRGVCPNANSWYVSKCKLVVCVQMQTQGMCQNANSWYVSLQIKIDLGCRQKEHLWQEKCELKKVHLVYA